jgi:diadenosine tetraphosphate (Ap4A) HIT family hydrolase
MYCPFCLEIANPNYYREAVNHSWKFPHRTLFETTGAIVVPGHGPLTYPYALVISKHHCSSFFDLTVKDRTFLWGCLETLACVSDFGGTLAVFEHGGGSKESCQCIDHCHLHVVANDVCPVPTWFKLESEYLLQELDLRSDTTLNPQGSYLFAGTYRYGDSWVKGLYAEVDDCRQPQYFRKMIARNLKLGDYNWRAGMNPEYIERLYRCIRGIT